MKVKALLFISFILLASSLKGQNLLSFSGKVVNSSASGIQKASVHLLNTGFSAVTDETGAFSINNIAEGTYTIEISAIGYASINEVLNISPAKNNVEFRLAEISRQLNTVNVTAQKFDEDIQAVPFSISSLSSRQIEDYRLWNSKDITAIVPNLYSSNPGDNRNVTSLRGIATTSYDPAVATYIDGVNQFGLDTYISQLLDIERIEVLRGPQGTLYGRNAMGGVVNIITKQPTNRPSGFAELNFGSYGQQRMALGLRSPIIKNKLYLGIAGLYNHSDGFYTNEFYDNQFDRQNNIVGNYYLKFVANSRLSFNLNIKHNENRNHGTFPLASSKEEALNNPFIVNQDAVTKMIDNNYNSSLSVNYYGSKFNFTSQTAYQSNQRYYDRPIDGDFSPIDGVSIINNYGGNWNKVKVTTQEFRLTSPASSSSTFRWVLGTYGFYQDNPVRQGTHFGADGELVGAPANTTDISTNKGYSSGLAVFGQGTLNLASKFDLTFGLRYDYEHKSQKIRGEFQPDGEEAFITRSDTSAKANFKAFSPRISFNYSISNNHHLYTTYSRGFRAGGITQLVSDPTQPPLIAYKPEYSDNIEIGSKNTFLDSRLKLNATLFYTSVSDAQVPTLILPDAVTITQNAGELVSKGFELELASTPARGLELDYNFGYTDTKYTRLRLPDNGEISISDNNRQVFTPDFTSSLAMQYGYDLGSKNNYMLILRGEWRYLGKQFFDLANQIHQDAYNLLNAKIGVTSKIADLYVWGSNLANKRFVDYAYNFGAAHLGNPRIYGLTVRKTF